MNNYEKKKQILLSRGYNNELSGKTIDKVSLFVDNCECYNGELLITFTDDTYILLAPEYDNDQDEYILENSDIQPLNEKSSVPGNIYNGVFRYDMYFQRYVDCGIIDIDTDLLKKWVDDAERRKEDREYNEYLRLKKKFENVDSEK